MELRKWRAVEMVCIQDSSVVGMISRTTGKVAYIHEYFSHGLLLLFIVHIVKILSGKILAELFISAHHIDRSLKSKSL